MVTVYALFIMLILSFIIIMMSQKTVVYIATRADTYLEKQAYWNAQSGRSIFSLNDTRAVQKILDTDDGWDIGEIEVPISGGEPEGRTGRGSLQDIISPKTISLGVIPTSLSLTSDSFTPGGPIPSQFVCAVLAGQNNSPQLRIANTPPGAVSLVLIMDDKDIGGGGPWPHWLVWGISPLTTEINIDWNPGTPQGLNYLGAIGYAGPCPPAGTHRYDFTLYAMDNNIDLSAGSNMTELNAAISDHILAQTTLTGTFAR